jgi:hypothetical protein
LAGTLVTTLAFFVAFSELIKLFFSIVINQVAPLVVQQDVLDAPFRYLPL